MLKISLTAEAILHTIEFREMYEWRMNVSRVQGAFEPPAHGEFMAIP